MLLREWIRKAFDDKYDCQRKDMEFEFLIA